MDELASGEKIVGYASTPFEIAQVLAKRRYQLGLTGRCLDQVAGLADGHTTKLESAVKTLGQISLPTLLAALGCRLALVADDAAIPDRTREYMGTAGVSSYAHGAPACRRIRVADDELDLAA